MIRRVIAALLLLLTGTVATAQVPFPQTLPANTVYGRLGISAGPGQAIPFSVLTTNLFASLCQTDGAVPIYKSSTATWVCTTAAGAPAAQFPAGIPLVLGGTAASSSLTLQSTSNGAPSGDQIIFNTGGTTKWLITSGGNLQGSGASGVFGGTSNSSTLILASTTTAPGTDSIILRNGTKTSWTIENAPGSNTYTPTTGSVPGLLVTRAGANNCATTGIFVTPGIGPAPSAGQAFFCSDLADSTAGNVSNIFAVAWNSGTRFTAGVTGIGVAKPGALLTNVWGLQGSAILLAGSTGIGQGANLECDSSSAGAVCIAVTLKLGDSTLSGGSVPGNSYINMLADAGRQPANAIRFQASAINNARTNFIMGTEGGSAVNGIDFSLTTFTTTAFKSPGFSVDNLGNIAALNSGAILPFIANANVPAATTAFFGAGQSAAEGVMQIYVPKAFTAKQLRAASSVAPGGVQTHIFTLRKNNADTAITCTITGAATTCSDTTNTVSYAAGDTLAMKIVTSGTAAASSPTATILN